MQWSILFLACFLWVSSPFKLDPQVQVAFRTLWSESIEAKEERVACIGGRINSPGVVRIDRIKKLVEQQGDSLRASYIASREQCRPPDWLGTVHTHITLYRGYPYSTFSSSDREIMAIWSRMYGDEGLFCVLYTAKDVYCEYGQQNLSGDLEY